MLNYSGPSLVTSFASADASPNTTTGTIATTIITGHGARVNSLHNQGSAGPSGPARIATRWRG